MWEFNVEPVDEWPTLVMETDGVDWDNLTQLDIASGVVARWQALVNELQQYPNLDDGGDECCPACVVNRGSCSDCFVTEYSGQPCRHHSELTDYLKVDGPDVLPAARIILSMAQDLYNKVVENDI